MQEKVYAIFMSDIVKPVNIFVVIFLFWTPIFHNLISKVLLNTIVVNGIKEVH